MDAREQLLKTLMQDLESFQTPERYTAAQKAQIEKGRKGQKDIDAGRATIAENERLYQEALTKRGELQTRIGNLSNEIDTAKGTARQQGQEDFERSPAGQAYDVSKIAVPVAGGMYYGHKAAKSIEARQANMSPSRLAAMGAGRRFAPYGGKAMTYFLPEGAALRGYVAPNMKEGTAKDLVNAAGTGLIASGLVTAGEGIVKSLTPPKIAGLDDALPPPPPPPNAPAQPAALRTPSDRLTSAARAAGATGKLTKTTAAEYLAANVTPQNRAVVAAELGVGPGEKITSAVKKLAASRKSSMIVGPMIAAGLGYDAASSDAEAAGATPAEARTRGAVVGTGAAAVTGGAMYGAKKLANFAPVKSLLNVASKASGPLMLNDMAMQTHRGIYGSGPQFLDVPEKSPVRSQLSSYAAEANGPLSNASALQIRGNIPPNAARDAEAAAVAAEGPSPARAAYGDQKFDDALSGFLAMIEEHNNSLQGAQ